MGRLNLCAMDKVMLDIERERINQHSVHGEQNLPNGTAGENSFLALKMMRAAIQEAEKNNSVSWMLLLDEEICEAFAEEDPRKLRAELVQVAAVAVQWIEAIDRSYLKPRSENETFEIK